MGNREWEIRDILEIIMNKLLNVDDYFRLGAVSTTWLSAFHGNNAIRESRNQSFPPFLLISPPPSPQPQVDDQQRALYSLSRERVYNFRLHVPHNKVCRGSSFGWLITIQRKPEHDWLIELLNPFLSRSIELPPPNNIALQHVDDTGWNKNFIWKAVLSHNPLSSPDFFVVLAIMSRYKGLAFFRPGNTTWTSIGEAWHMDYRRDGYYMDVIFSRKTNCFYALRLNGAVFAINFPGDDKCGDPKLTTDVALPLFGESGCAHLVEDTSSGDLFLVYKRFYPHDPQHVLLPYTDLSPESLKAVFVLYKLNMVSQMWMKIHNIGDNIMFLGSNASTMRPSSTCPGCTANCIYYTDIDDITGSRYRRHGPPFDGVYSLEDGVMRPHYESPESNKTCIRAIWIEPTLPFRTSQPYLEEK